MQLFVKYFQNKIAMKFVLAHLLLICLPLSAWPQQNGLESDHIIDSLNACLKTKQNDTSKIKTLNAIALRYNRINNPKQSIQWASRAQLLAKKASYKKGLQKSYNLVGSGYFNMGNYELSLKNYLLSLDLAKSIDDKLATGWAYNNLGVTYKQRGYYEKAIESFIDALKIYEELKNEKEKGTCYGNIGNIYLKMENYDKALEQYNISLAFAKKNSDSTGVALAHNNIGIIYYAKANYKKALENILKAVTMKSKWGNNNLAYSYHSAGLVYYKLGYYQVSLNYYLKALQIYQKHENLAGIADIFFYMGWLYSTQCRYTEENTNHLQALIKNNSIYKLLPALEFTEHILQEKKYEKIDTLEKAFVLLNQSLALSSKVGNKTLINDAYTELANLAKKMDNYELAYHYQKLHSDMHDTLYTEKLNNQIVQMSINYENQLKEKKIQLLTKDVETKELQVLIDKKNRQFIIVSAVSITILSFIVIAYIFIVRNKKQKKNIEAIEKEKTISELNFLKSQISPHTMFNNLNTIYFQMDSDTAGAKEMILKVSDLLRYQLYECNSEFIRIEKEINYMHNFIEVQQLRKSERCTINFFVGDNLTNFLIAPFLFLPLLENAFKYVTNDKNAENYIYIALTKNESGIAFTIENTTHTDPYSQDHIKKSAGSGIGLTNLKNRLQLIYADEYEFSAKKENNIFKINLTINERKTKAILVDDEPAAIMGLTSYIQDIGYIELIETCENVMDANLALSRQHIDLMFLDIHMPKITGLEFLKTLKKKPITIITSAHSEYALEGFELEVVDYLLKPFSFDRFLKACNKAKEYFDLNQNQKPLLNTNTFFFVKSEKKIEKVFFDEILYIEALHNYIAIVTEKEKLITHLTLKNIESILPKNYFVKIQKSFIVSVGKVKQIDGDEVIIKEKRISISRTNKNEIIKIIVGSNYITR